MRPQLTTYHLEVHREDGTAIVNAGNAEGGWTRGNRRLCELCSNESIKREYSENSRFFFLLSWDHDTAEEYEVKLSSTYRLVSDPSNPRSGSIFASLGKSVNIIWPSKAKRGESPILVPLRKRECMRTAKIGPDLRLR